MAFSTRRGRPPRPVAADTPDHGTPELQAKREAGLTQEALDLCLKADIVTEDQHWAGVHLRWLYTLRYGAKRITSSYAQAMGNPASEEEDSPWRHAREVEYREAIALLTSEHAAEILLRVAVFNHLPRWARAGRSAGLSAEEIAEKQVFLSGLSALHRHWRMEKKHSLKTAHAATAPAASRLAPSRGGRQSC